MSDITEVLNTGNYAHYDRDISKIFIFDNEFSKGTLANDTGGSKTYLAGTVLGRTISSGELIPLESDATDGSAKPVGILAQDVTIANGADAAVYYCVAGQVNKSKLIFENGTDTVDTVTMTYVDGTAVAPGMPIKDALESQTKGIKLVVLDEITDYDNQ